MPSGRTSFTWHGAAITLRADEACAFALEETAVQMAEEMKNLCAVDTGTLQRSFHTAPPGYMNGDSDFERAARGEDLLNTGVEMAGAFGRWGKQVEVGSWIPYACVEEQRDGAVSNSVSIVAGGRSTANYVEALAAEGIYVAPL